MIQDACRDLGLGTCAERWVQIYYYLVERRYYRGGEQISLKEEEDKCFDPVLYDDGERDNEEDHWDYAWLPDDLIAWLNILFLQVSNEFDRLFYVAGKCNTRKNNIYGYTTDEVRAGVAPRDARHNILRACSR